MKRMILALSIMTLACGAGDELQYLSQCMPVDDACNVCRGDWKCYTALVEDRLGCGMCAIFDCPGLADTETLICKGCGL